MAKTCATDSFKVFQVVGNSTSQTTHREGGPDHHGEAEELRTGEQIFLSVANITTSRFTTYFCDDSFKNLAILAAAYCVNVRPDELHSILLQDALFVQGDRSIECSLSAESCENRVRTFDLNNSFNEFSRNRFDIRCIREFGICHDCCWIRIDQRNANPFSLQHTACLSPRVIKLACLTNDDRAGSDDQNRIDITAFRHYLTIMSWNCRKRSSASCGPAAASGWYCTLKAGAPSRAIPSTTPSFRDRWVTRPFP